ncbi:streptophobe family protein, partial [Streptomyces rimosus]|uniref:streptophobe family protein n=1 Tax=Streptomyces rimosus TaxID=1927 RepID=UPI0006B29F48
GEREPVRLRVRRLRRGPGAARERARGVRAGGGDGGLLDRLRDGLGGLGIGDGDNGGLPERIADLIGAKASVGFAVDTGASLAGGLVWVLGVLVITVLAARRAPLPRALTAAHRFVRPAASALVMVALVAVAAGLAAAGYAAIGDDHPRRVLGAALLAAPNGVWLGIPLGLFVPWHGSASGVLTRFLPDPVDRLLDGGNGARLTIGRLAELDGRVWLLPVAAVLMMLLAGVLTAVRTPREGARTLPFALRCAAGLGALTALTLPLLVHLTGVSANASLSVFGFDAFGAGLELRGSVPAAFALGAVERARGVRAGGGVGRGGGTGGRPVGVRHRGGRTACRTAAEERGAGAGGRTGVRAGRRRPYAEARPPARGPHAGLRRPGLLRRCPRARSVHALPRLPAPERRHEPVHAPAGKPGAGAVPAPAGKRPDAPAAPTRAAATPAELADATGGTAAGDPDLAAASGAAPAHTRLGPAARRARGTHGAPPREQAARESPAAGIPPHRGQRLPAAPSPASPGTAQAARRAPEAPRGPARRSAAARTAGRRPLTDPVRTPGERH